MMKISDKCTLCNLCLEDREYKTYNGKTYCAYCLHTAMLKDADGTPLYFGYMVDE